MIASRSSWVSLALFIPELTMLPGRCDEDSSEILITSLPISSPSCPGNRAAVWKLL